MQALKKFLRHHGLFCLLLIILAYAGLARYYHWSSTTDLVSLSTLAVTAVLAAITWQYVRTTQDTLAIMTKQWEYNNETGIAFGVKTRRHKPWVRIANTGGTRLFLAKTVFRRRGEKPFNRISIRVISSGENYGFYIPQVLYPDGTDDLDVDITLHYQDFNKKELTISRAFRIEFVNGRVYHIKRGVHEFWIVPCPKCEARPIFMNTDDLENHAEAYLREALFKEELGVTCPNHQSQWMENINTARARNKRDEDSGKEL